MRFIVEGWAPEYGSPFEVGDEDAFDPERVDLDAETPLGSWAPVEPGITALPRSVLFVDGVRRVDARIWVDDDGAARQGICASYGAGVVRCEGRATVETCRVARGLFVPSPPGPIKADKHAVYEPYATAGSEDRQLFGELQQQLGNLEIAVAGEAGAAELVVIDGPLTHRERIPGAMGYIKTHRAAYLPPEGQAVVAALQPGQRTPYFLTQTTWSRYSWYLRLPGGSPHAMGGVVRCEVAASLSRSEVARFANVSAAVLPRFASSSFREARAPQNLYPIAGLEAALRRRLGDRDLLERALRRAAGQPA